MKKEFGIILSAVVLVASGFILDNWHETQVLAHETVHLPASRPNLSTGSDLVKPDRSVQLRILRDYDELPLAFEKNQGQTDSRVKFFSREPGYTLFLTNDAAIFSLHGSEVSTRSRKESERGGARQTTISRRSNSSESGHLMMTSVVRMRLVGVSSNVLVRGADELPGKANYFIGKNPKNWRSSVPLYTKVQYQGVYPGINLLYYGNHQQLEFDFLVAPGADPRHIQFDLHGSQRLRLDDDGDLVLNTETGKDGIRWHKPVAYQEKKGMRQVVAVDYAIISGNRVGFKIGKYDASRPLYIDPLIYSTYLGGSGNDGCSGIAVDSAGNAYVTGATSSTNFPTMNPLQPTLGGINNAFVTKLNASGSALVYSTFLGGSGNDDGFGIAVDSSGNAYVTGDTNSTDFPTLNPLQPTLGGGQDAFVTKINGAGSALVYSTYLGGSGNDIGSGIAVDSVGNAYVAGATGSTNFPTMNPLQPTFGGPLGGQYADAFAAKINASGSALVYSTYLGGSGTDGANAIAVDSAGNAYVTGDTSSTDFPTLNPLQPTLGGGQDAFVTKINASGSALVYSTYLGGSGADDGWGIAVDSSGNAYVIGITESTNFPTMNPLQPAFGGGQDAFVTKINGAGSALVYSTYLGGSGVENGNGIAVDGSGNAYATGETNSSNFPTMNPLQPTLGGLYNAYAAKINASGSALVYSTYLGGSGTDGADGIAVDSAGNAYVAGFTTSTDFPTMNPLQPANGGQHDAFVAKIGAVTAGADFSLAAATGGNCPMSGNCSTTSSVTAGQSATYDLQVEPVNGFNGTVALSCSDTLAESTCSVSPSSVSVNGTASAFAVTVTTTAASVLGPQTNAPSVGPPSQIVLLSLIILILALILIGSRTESNRWKGRFVPSLAVLLLGFVLLAGCGGGASGGGNNGGGGGNNGTPSGTITVTGNSSGVSHSASLTLNVN